MDDDLNQLVFELGLDYEMQNSMLQATQRGNVNAADFLENFTASAEIWRDNINLGDIEGEASTLDSIPFATRLSFSQLPHVQSSGTLSSIPHIQIPLPENNPPAPTQTEPPHETVAFRQTLTGPRPASLLPTPAPTRPSSVISTPLSVSPAPSSSNNSPPSQPTAIQIPANNSSNSLHKNAGESSFSSLSVYFQDEEGRANQRKAPQGSGADTPVKNSAKRKAAEPVKPAKSANGDTPTEKRRKIFVAGDSGNEESDEEEDEETRKRIAHTSAEQKRRDNIKSAFNELKGLLPQYKEKGNVSKALLLKAAIDLIKQLTDNKEELLLLRKENDDMRQTLGLSLRGSKKQQPVKPHPVLPPLPDKATGAGTGTGNETLAMRIPSEPKLHHYFD